jgi:hypothetical protein
MKTSQFPQLPQNDDGLVSTARRDVLRVAAATGLALPLAGVLGDAGLFGAKEAKAEPRVRETYWQGDYFVQNNVDISQVESGIIRARIDGVWRDFSMRDLGDDFIDWNFGARIDGLTGGMSDCLAGPHSGCLASYGANRGDSAFTINAAFKGFGFFPNPAEIDARTDTLLTHWADDIMAKAGILLAMYRNRAMWDFRFLSSLELYTTQDFETHSFLNQMANPQVAINWLAIPGSYEVRAVPHLLHPQDPGLSDIDKKRLLWVNSMHDFYHGDPASPPDPANLSYIGVVYHVVEVFDNSPYPGPMGVRSTPPL